MSMNHLLIEMFEALHPDRVVREGPDGYGPRPDVEEPVLFVGPSTPQGQDGDLWMLDVES